MNKHVTKVVTKHALCVGAFAAAVTVIYDLKKLYALDRK